MTPRFVTSLAAALSVAALPLPSSALAAPNVTSTLKGLAGKCVDVPDGNTANGTRIQLWDCNGTNAQNWSLVADGTLRAFGKCLDVSTSGTTNGTAIQLWDCNGTSAQQWIHTPSNDLVNPQANKCLDLPDGNSTSGTKLQLWDCNGTGAQKWTASVRPVNSRRTVVYYQTQYYNGAYVSPLGLTNNNTRVSDVIVAAIHLNSPTHLHLNHHPPTPPHRPPQRRSAHLPQVHPDVGGPRGDAGPGRASARHGGRRGPGQLPAPRHRLQHLLPRPQEHHHHLQAGWCGP